MGVARIVARNKKGRLRFLVNGLFMGLRGEDLNLRPSGYEPDELPDCSTPRCSFKVRLPYLYRLVPLGSSCQGLLAFSFSPALKTTGEQRLGSVPKPTQLPRLPTLVPFPKPSAPTKAPSTIPWSNSAPNQIDLLSLPVPSAHPFHLPQTTLSQLFCSVPGPQA